MIESGPIPAVHGVVRWRLIDLAQWIFEEFRITIAKQTLSRELREIFGQGTVYINAKNPFGSGGGAAQTGGVPGHLPSMAARSSPGSP